MDQINRRPHSKKHRGMLNNTRVFLASSAHDCFLAFRSAPDIMGLFCSSSPSPAGNTKDRPRELGQLDGRDGGQMVRGPSGGGGC